MRVVEVRTSLWEALAGRAPGPPRPTADADLWRMVVERLNPARARPRLRAGIEAVRLTTVRGVEYVMLRSPDRGEACYQRLSPHEYALALQMDGTRTVAGLVAQFLQISGRLSPDQVGRLVAELAANRMLEELPVDAFAPLRRIHRGSRSRRLGRGLLAFARGRRVVLANVDPLVGFVYRFGGRLLFTRVVATALATIALVGLGVFVWTWSRGAQSAFLVGDSYATGALTLLGLNVLALGCHEMGHALAAKHAGRRVPAAGFLLYFGIPSAFVDTTDVWMAGRRARLRTTAAGPAAALTLAGAGQLVGLAYPSLAAVCFKLSFAWYLNSLFNLNPLLALDGYYLLMDWLEVPNLRARGIAFLVLTVRRRRPRWSTLDREGRLVAGYGILSALWLLIAANLGYRVYVDRIAGAVTGLWYRGIGARGLLVALVVGLAAPLVGTLAGWLGRRVGRVPQWVARRRREADRPRRLDALRASALAALPSDALAELARTGRWLHPRSGSAVITAGATPRAVYVVASGTLEAHAPGDPPGSARERATPGHVVGAATALVGGASALTWTTVGTRLLALPVDRFVALAGPAMAVAGVTHTEADRAELEQLLDAAPALAGLAEEERLTVLGRARPVDLAAGESHQLAVESGAALVAAGVITASDAAGVDAAPGGAERRRGDVLLAGEAPVTAAARTRSRLWRLPTDARLAVLLGAASSGTGHRSAPSHTGPTAGVHPAAAAYPLLQPPVGPPPTDDPAADRRLERAGRRLALLLLLAVLIAVNTLAAISWTEMPRDRALLTIARGAAVATLDGDEVRLSRGERRYVRLGDAVAVEPDSLARLTFHGGGQTVLCAGTRVRIGIVSTHDGEPAGELALDRGRAIAATATASGAFAPLRLRVGDGDHLITNDGAARYAVSPGDLTVASGRVRLDGVPQPTLGSAPGCAGAGGSAVGGPGAGPGTADPGAGPTPATSGGRSASAGPTTPAASSSPAASRTGPANTPPVIDWVRVDSLSLSQARPRDPCYGGPTTTRITARVHDTQTATGLTVIMSYVLSGHPEVAGSVSMTPTTRTGPVFQATLGPIPYAAAHAGGGTLTVTIRALDAASAPASPVQTTVRLTRC
jgi:putative peptide zinc metalloprotease protein